MITKSTFEFLSGLKENNNRDWFLEHKKEYERSKKEVEEFLSQLIPIINALDPNLQSPDIKDCIFRIFKDIRFSKDKTPYKTNFGAFIAKGGRKTVNPGYYFHLEPGGSFIAAGIYMPQPEIIKKVRNEIYFNSNEFRKIIETKAFRDYFGKLDEFDKMKKPPKEYPADFPDIDLLKYRSVIVEHAVADEIILSGNYEKLAIEVVKVALPLNNFLNRAISNH